MSKKKKLQKQVTKNAIKYAEHTEKLDKTLESVLREIHLMGWEIDVGKVEFHYSELLRQIGVRPDDSPLIRAMSTAMGRHPDWSWDD